MDSRELYDTTIIHLACSNCGKHLITVKSNIEVKTVICPGCMTINNLK